MQTVLTTVADQAARDAGFVRRRRQLSGAAFAQALVLGWLDNPQATLDDLAAAAALAGAPVCPSALDQRFTPQAADCLRRVLQAALTHVLAAQPAAAGLLARFHGVYLLDGTTLTLPDGLAELWPGCGGRTARGGRAGLKVQLRWGLTGGARDGLTLHAARAADAQAALNSAPLPAGGLRLADLGYFDLAVLRDYDRAGVWWLSRLKHGTAV
jgi:hypothetical protein